MESLLLAAAPSGSWLGRRAKSQLILIKAGEAARSDRGGVNPLIGVKFDGYAGGARSPAGFNGTE